jgi:hypothetical protein
MINSSSSLRNAVLQFLDEVGTNSPQLALSFSHKKDSEAQKSGERDGPVMSPNREIKRAENIPLRRVILLPCRVDRCDILFKPYISQNLPQTLQPKENVCSRVQ